MYKVITVVCVLAIVALGTSVISAVIQNSRMDTQSQQISSLSSAVTKDGRKVSVLSHELHQRHRTSGVSTHTHSPQQLRRLTSDGEPVIMMRHAVDSTHTGWLQASAVRC